jgi:hypothetical protein
MSGPDPDSQHKRWLPRGPSLGRNSMMFVVAG